MKNKIFGRKKMNKKSQAKIKYSLIGLFILIGIISVYFIMVLPVVSSSETWWNSSWEYKQLITINFSDSVDLSDYWIDFTLQLPAGHFKSDYSDLRFVNYEEDTEMVWKYSRKNATEIYAWVFTESTTENVSSGGIQFWAYYNTSSFVEPGWTNDFYYGDTFMNQSSLNDGWILRNALGTSNWALNSLGGFVYATGSNGGNGPSSSLSYDLPNETSGWGSYTINWNGTWTGCQSNDGSYLSMMLFSPIDLTSRIGVMLNGRYSGYANTNLYNYWDASLGTAQNIGVNICNNWIYGSTVQVGGSNSSSVTRTQKSTWVAPTSGSVTETTSSYITTNSPTLTIYGQGRWPNNIARVGWILISHGNGTISTRTFGAEEEQVVLDTISPTYSNAQTNTTDAGVAILFSVLYDDDTALETNGTYIFSTNNTGVWANESAVNFTATPSWANVTKTLNSTVGNYIGYRWYADDNAGNVNNTGIFYVTTTDVTFPSINITYPTATTYSENVSDFNYTYTELNPDSCWYSIDDGVTNSSLVNMGTNFTDVLSVGGSNTWMLYCNDTSNNLNVSSITFNVNVLWYNTGYPFTNKSFRITEFINVSGTNFTLGGENYRFLGADSYYLADYATNHTYDDDGNEINNSREYVLEILNEAHYLNINVIRTWAGMQGGIGSHWVLNETGGHYNLFEINEPGNYSEDMFVALDWVIYEASKRDVRLQLVFVNNWNDYGGMRWYAQMSPTTDKTHENVSDYSDDNYWLFHDQFYDDENCMQYYRDYINYTLNRNNTYSGILYKDDPTIFAWLLANEPRAKSDGTGRSLIRDWTINMTAYVKSIDSNHLVGLGIEGWGYVETWGEGTDMIADHNETGVDFATYALHPDQWQYFAERSEHDGGGWVIEGTGTNDFVDWWTNDSDVSYNNRYEVGYVPAYTPALARYGYDNWVVQNIKWADDLGLPILLQEAGYLTNHEKPIKDRFYEQMIHNFYNEGGDGLLFWTLNHDNYYYSTDVNGTMDDGYGFYLSDDPFLINKSESIIDAINFTKHDNVGGSWITELNDYKYDFVFNIGFASDTGIDNCTLYLNVSNGTWSGYYADQSNSTPIIYNDDYTFTTQFDTADEEFYWYTACYGDSTFINSTVSYVQVKSATPVINLVSPGNNTSYNTDTLNFFYNVSNEIEISFCELYIDDNLNKTDYTISIGINQSFSVSDLSDAAHNWSIKCTDIDSNEGFSETRNFDIDATHPYFITIPENTTITYTQGFGVQFNATDEVEFDTYAINWTTLFAINSTGYLKNSTIIAVGTYLINVTINDTLNNINSTMYKVTVNKAVPAGSLTNTDTWTEPYLESVTIGLSESNPGDDDVTYIVYRDGISKDTGETITLGVGNYDYVLNTTGGANWTASVSMDAQTLTVTKADPSTNMDIDGTTPIIYPTMSDFSESETNAGDGGCSYFMDRSNRIYGVDESPITFNYSTSGCDNYTAGYETKNLVVNQNTTYVLTITGTTPIEYGTITNVVGGGCPTELSCSLDKANAVYGVGTETFNYSTPGNTNYSSKYITKDIVINKATLVASITNSRENTFAHDGTPANIGISESNTGDGDVVYILWKDNVNVGTSDTEEDIGVFNYKLNSTGGANYSSSASLDTLTLTIKSIYPDLVKRITQVLQALIVLSSVIIVLLTVKSFYEEERTLGEVIRTSLYVGLGAFLLILLMPVMVMYIADLIV